MAHEGTPRRSHTVTAAHEAPRDRVLRFATLVFATGFLLHNADHLRRGLGVITPQVFWGGVVIGVLAVTAVTLVLVRHPLAPVVAVAVGFTTALGVSASHLLPHWSAFSDSLPAGGVDALSWAAVLLEIAGALALGAAGAYLLRRGGWHAVARTLPGVATEPTEAGRGSA